MENKTTLTANQDGENSNSKLDKKPWISPNIDLWNVANINVQFIGSINDGAGKTYI